MEASSVLAFRVVFLSAIMMKNFSHRHRLHHFVLGEYGWACVFFYCPTLGVWTAIIPQLPYVFAELCLVAFCSVVEAGSMVRVSCLEGCGSQSNIGLFLIRCFYFRFINDILGSTFSR